MAESKIPALVKLQSKEVLVIAVTGAVGTVSVEDVGSYGVDPFTMRVDAMYPKKGLAPVVDTLAPIATGTTEVMLYEFDDVPVLTPFKNALRVVPDRQRTIWFQAFAIAVPPAMVSNVLPPPL
jgi:hypothetical protein